MGVSLLIAGGVSSACLLPSNPSLGLARACPKTPDHRAEGRGRGPRSRRRGGISCMVMRVWPHLQRLPSPGFSFCSRAHHLPPSPAAPSPLPRPVAPLGNSTGSRVGSSHWRVKVKKGRSRADLGSLLIGRDAEWNWKRANSFEFQEASRVSPSRLPRVAPLLRAAAVQLLSRNLT